MNIINNTFINYGSKANTKIIININNEDEHNNSETSRDNSAQAASAAAALGPRRWLGARRT